MEPAGMHRIINSGYAYFSEMGHIILGKFKCGKRSALKSRDVEVIVSKVKSNISGMSPRCLESDHKQELFYEEAKTNRYITNLSGLLYQLSSDFKKMTISSTDNFEPRTYEEAVEKASAIARRADAALEIKIPKLVRDSTKELADAAAYFASSAKAKETKITAMKLLDEVGKVLNVISDNELIHTVTKETFSEIIKLTDDLESEATIRCARTIDEFNSSILILMRAITDAKKLSRSTYQDYYQDYENGEYEAVDWDQVRVFLPKASTINKENLSKLDDVLNTIDEIVEKERRVTLSASFYRKTSEIKAVTKRLEMLLLEVNSARAEEIEASQLALRAESCVEWLK